MFDKSPRTARMIAFLKGVNGTASHAAISAHMGEETAALRSVVAVAIRVLERDEGIVFVNVRGEGYRRLTDAEKVESSKVFTARIRRSAGKGVARIGAVSDMSALSNADQLAATLRMAVFQAVQRETGEVT